jgi:hypothetical protein
MVVCGFIFHPYTRKVLEKNRRREKFLQLRCSNDYKYLRGKRNNDVCYYELGSDLMSVKRILHCEGCFWGCGKGREEIERALKGI